MKPETTPEKPDYIDIHTLALVQAAMDCLHKTHPLTSVDKDIKDAFEHLSIAKDKLMGNYDD